MAQITNQNEPWRVFVSSTYEDMIPYREAVSNALTSIEQLPIGMEHFVSAPDRPLDVCLTDVRRCHLYIVIVGMRYGSIDDETGKSFTELEYEEAVKNRIPVLAFVIDENECPVLPKFVDVGDKAEKLQKFKNSLDKRMTSRFKSPDDLKNLVVRSVEAQVKRASDIRETKKQTETDQADYIEGAKLFKRFLLLPERYKGKETVLRIRMDGVFSTWRLKDELFEAFGIKNGDALFGNDATVFGVDFGDIDENANTIDFFAEGKNADWILDNDITNGTVFEGKFKFAYEIVEGVAHRSNGAVDAKIATLILLEGRSIISQETPDKSAAKKKRKSQLSSIDAISELLLK